MVGLINFAIAVEKKSLRLELLLFGCDSVFQFKSCSIINLDANSKRPP